MKKLTRRLEKRRRALLERYDEEDLHQLRITLRRMRGRLEGAGDKELRQLRKDLGALADTTNAARDWDTLALYARTRLSVRQFETLAPWLRQQQQTAHTLVLELLESDQWHEILARWKDYSPDTVDTASQYNTAIEEGLPDAMQRVSVARVRALDRERDRDWHKLRIAIKELRYRLDEQPKEERDRQVRQTLSLCKQLQEELGSWHDTVVHRQLLHGADQRNGTALEPETVSTLETFEEKLIRHGEECLDRVRAMLIEPSVERALSPVPH
jgi:CHAD domain-containing protein